MFKSSKRFQSFASRVSFLLLLVMMGGSVSPGLFMRLDDTVNNSLGYSSLFEGIALAAEPWESGSVRGGIPRGIPPAPPDDQASGPDPDACTFSGGIWERAVGALACVAYGIFKFASWIAMLAALMLNTIINYLIVGMSDIVRPLGDKPGDYSAIEEVWKVIRDLTNVFLVFLTVFIGIATIVGISGYGYKQLLWKVILAAIFVNFSITLAYFVIDIGNFTTITIYHALLLKSGAPAEIIDDCVSQLGSIDVGDGNNQCRTHGIAGAFINLFSMSSFYDVSLNNVGDGSLIEKKWRLFFAFLLAGAFMLVLAFVFAAGAFLIIGRFVILMFVILASPIGLVMWITGVSGIGRRWWHTLINQTLIAPLLMLFWFITYVLMDGFINAMALSRYDGSGMTAGNLAQFSDATTLTYIMMFVVGIGFLIASLVAAKSLGAYGATGAINLGKSMSRKSAMFVGGVAGAATVGSAAWAMRQGAGRVADKAESSAALKKMAGSTNLLAKTFAKTARATTQKVKSSSFDARALTGKTGQQWMGQSQKGGYTQWKKDETRKMEETKAWVGEAAPSSEDKRGRDAEQKQNTESFEAMRQGRDLRARAPEQRELVASEVNALKAELQKAEDKGDDRGVKLINEKLEAKKAEEQRWIQMDTSLTAQGAAQQQVHALEKDLRTGMMLDPITGRSVIMTKDEREKKEALLKEKQQEMQEHQSKIDDNIGVFDNNVSQLDQEIQKTEEAMGATTDAKVKQTFQKKIDSIKNEREIYTKYYQARTALANGTALGIDEAEMQRLDAEMGQATAVLSKLEGDKGAAIDRRYSDKMKQEGADRANRYLNVAGAQREFVVLPTPDWRREAAVKLREPIGAERRFRDFEKFMEDYEKEKGKKEVTPESEPPTTTGTTT